MKAQLLKLPSHSDCSFNAMVHDVPYFVVPWHYHPEYEIGLMINDSTGKKFIGSSITDFKPGDLCLIGANLPHYYRSEETFYDKKNNLRTNSIVIQFREDFLGENFWNLPEGAAIKDLLARSKNGLQITGETNALAIPKIKRLLELDGMDKLLELISILNLFSKSKNDDVSTLSSRPMEMPNTKDNTRMNKVFEHIMQHYQQPIRLEELADLANMSESAFSRYFKKITRRNFSDFLFEIRIDHACKLLIETTKSVSDICYESGFNNHSNFNRQFLKIKKLTPLAFRNKYIR